tara:strand:+ start:551 stop:757 length:207 start_codon:yes stop_codon:yes gene_type:complete
MHSKLNKKMKKNIPLIVIIASSILIIANFITSEKIDGEFWLRISSSALIILCMILTIRERKKKDKKSN